MLELASMFLADGDESEYTYWMDMAILEAAGQKELQQKLIQAKSDVAALKGMEVFNLPSNTQS